MLLADLAAAGASLAGPAANHDREAASGQRRPGSGLLLLIGPQIVAPAQPGLPLQQRHSVQRPPSAGQRREESLVAAAGTTSSAAEAAVALPLPVGWCRPRCCCPWPYCQPAVHIGKRQLGGGRPAAGTARASASAPPLPLLLHLLVPSQHEGCTVSLQYIRRFSSLSQQEDRVRAGAAGVCSRRHCKVLPPGPVGLRRCLLQLRRQLLLQRLALQARAVYDACRLEGENREAAE